MSVAGSVANSSARQDLLLVLLFALVNSHPQLHEDAHRGSKASSSHTLLPVEEAVKQRAKTRPIYCELHEEEQLKFFCDTCGKLVCRGEASLSRTLVVVVLLWTVCV